MQARVTHGAYIDAMSPHAKMPRPGSSKALDRREIGAVAWLQLDLTGYRHATMFLRWGLFHAGAGAALIPKTTHQARVPIDDHSDVQTLFQSVWLGTPRLKRFQAEFWLLEHGRVRQMASTGAMRGIAYRYAC